MAAGRSTVGTNFGVPLPAVPDGRERRTSERIDARIRATVRLADEVEDTPARARLLDISEGGLCMELERRMPVGAAVVLDLECELPLRVHLGYDADSLVVDGPMHTHLVRVNGTVVRSQRHPNRRWQVGVQLCPVTSRFDELQAVRSYVDHLHEQVAWSI